MSAIEEYDTNTIPLTFVQDETERKMLVSQNLIDRVFAYRIIGEDESAIGSRLGLPAVAISAVIDYATDQIAAYSQQTQRMRALEGARYDRAEVIVNDTLEGNRQGLQGEVERKLTLAAINQLLSISAARRKLFGMDAPAQVQVEGSIKYELVGIDPELLK